MICNPGISQNSKPTTTNELKTVLLCNQTLSSLSVYGSASSNCVSFSLTDSILFEDVYAFELEMFAQSITQPAYTSSYSYGTMMLFFGAPYYSYYPMNITMPGFVCNYICAHLRFYTAGSTLTSSGTLSYFQSGMQSIPQGSATSTSTPSGYLTKLYVGGSPTLSGLDYTLSNVTMRACAILSE